MPADRNVDGNVLEYRDASRFGNDFFDTSKRVPGNLGGVSRLEYEDSRAGPLLEVIENLGIVLSHLNCLVLGFLKIPVQCRAKEARSITKHPLMHIEKPFLGPDSELNNRIKGISGRRKAIEMPLVAVMEDSAYG